MHLSKSSTRTMKTLMPTRRNRAVSKCHQVQARLDAMSTFPTTLIKTGFQYHLPLKQQVDTAWLVLGRSSCLPSTRLLQSAYYQVQIGQDRYLHCIVFPTQVSSAELDATAQARSAKLDSRRIADQWCGRYTHRKHQAPANHPKPHQTLRQRLRLRPNPPCHSQRAGRYSGLPRMQGPHLISVHCRAQKGRRDVHFPECKYNTTKYLSRLLPGYCIAIAVPRGRRARMPN